MFDDIIKSPEKKHWKPTPGDWRKCPCCGLIFDFGVMKICPVCQISYHLEIKNKKLSLKKTGTRKADVFVSISDEELEEMKKKMELPSDESPYP